MVTRQDSFSAGLIPQPLQPGGWCLPQSVFPVAAFQSAGLLSFGRTERLRRIYPQDWQRPNKYPPGTSLPDRRFFLLSERLVSELQELQEHLLRQMQQENRGSE